ncbi:MAG: conjugal transfer protein TraH [Flavobacteriales bacterium]|nr:conjugal transfer protein TraH [Flavobacteriales bacterium]
MQLLHHQYNMFSKKYKLNLLNKLYALFVGIFLSVPLQADMASDMKGFFNSMGVSSNVSKGGSFNDQAGGYYTGGSLTTRTGSRTAQLATVQMPGYRAGCGGIDAWLGGFSHISKAELVGMLKNIGSSAASYAFMLAVQSTAPQIANIMNELNSLATTINNMNINSCEAAATMVGSVWPKADQASDHLCKTMGTNLGAFSDFAAARHGCGAGGKRGDTLSRRGSDGRYKDMLVGDFNLAWAAIQKNAFLKSDTKLAEAFMTIVGSIIVHGGDEGQHVQVIPAMAGQGNLIGTMLNGGKTKVYACDSEACLKPRLKDSTISGDKGLLRHVQDVLKSLVDKIYDDTPISESELAFLNSTSLPIYKMLNVMTAFSKGASSKKVVSYGELIAMDLVMQYVLQVIDIVKINVSQLRAVQVNDTDITQYLNGLSQTRRMIIERRHSAYQQMDSTLNMIKTTQIMEKQIHIMLSGVANDTNYL